MKLNRPITEDDLKHKGYPFECLNCGNKPTPQQVDDYHGDCEICGDTVIAYTIDAAEFFIRAENNLRTAWEAGFNLCRQYGDNQFHFRGEQKENQWKKFLETLK